MELSKNKPTKVDSENSGSASKQLSDQHASLSEIEQNFLLSQYSALREEVLKRIEIQHQLILGALVAIGTVLTVNTQSGSSAILLLYPFLAMFLTLAWSQNDHRNREITQYLAKKEKLFLTDASLGWEHSRTSSRLWIFGSRKVAAARGVFVGSQIFTLLLYWLKLRSMNQSISQDESILLFCSALVTVLSFLIIGFPSRHQKSRPN
jgi:positive regulator of sigma E activity